MDRGVYRITWISRWLFHFDAYSGHHQVSFEVKGQNKKASFSHYGLFCFEIKPFGLENDSGRFQRTIPVILESAKWQFPLVYLDAVVICSKMTEKHINCFWQVRALLQRAEVASKLKKCFLFTNKISYLEHEARPRCSEITSNAIGAKTIRKGPRNTGNCALS